MTPPAKDVALPIPSVNNIRKKSTANNCGTGKFAIASGYETNLRD